MKDVLTPAPARWNLAQALAGGGNDGVGDSRHDVDFSVRATDRAYEFGVSKRSDLN
jgi:hypothetical protein